MNLDTVWAAALITLSSSTIGNATPVQYQLTATHAQEYDYTFNSNEYLLPNGTPLIATFSYDAATPAASTNNPILNNNGSVFSNSGGVYSYYTSPIINFTGTVAGNTYFSGSADAFVGATDVYGNVIEIDSGENAPFGSVAAADFHGFSLGGFTLTGYTLRLKHSNQSYPDQSLPSFLNDATLSLVFRDSANNWRVMIFNDGNIAPVPLPDSAIFFLSGLIGLSTKLRKLKR